MFTFLSQVDLNLPFGPIHPEMNKCHESLESRHLPSIFVMRIREMVYVSFQDSIGHQWLTSVFGM